MANSTQGDGGFPNVALWASHRNMVMEPLETNDPEVRAPSWALPSSCFVHAELLEPGMGQGDSPRLS